MSNKLIVLAVFSALVLILLVAFNPITIVHAGSRGVVTTFGQVSDRVLDEGIHLVNPLSEVHMVVVQTMNVEAESTAASKDLQTVRATVVVNYHINPATVNRLYQTVQGDYATNVITPAIQDSVKAATAGFTAEELITKRGEVSDAIKASLTEKLVQFASVETVSITNFDFSESFNAAIEAKVTAEQDALAAKNKLAQTEYEAQQTVVKATAEAESLRIQAAALKDNQDLVELEAVRKWNGILPTYMLGDSVPFISVK